MTQLVVSFILANDFGCKTRTMVPWTCCSRQRQGMSFLAPGTFYALSP
jgi:hypothetical protein